MKRRSVALALLLMVLLSGCRAREPVDTGPVCRFVTRIRVTYENGNLTTRRSYTTDQKMQVILDYLRLIDPYGAPEEDPETVSGPVYRIVLSYSDGCEKEYLQKADRFMRVSGSWKRIDPEHAAELGNIVGIMKSDEEI